VLIVLASRFDADAASLVRRWHSQGARLLTCEDLSRCGWTWEPDAPSRGTLVLEGERVSLAAVRGAVSLLSCVGASELPHIMAEEREYVAGEMSAFLLAWLSSLSCHVINRPTPLCLTGPHLHREQWLQHASRVGLRIREAIRRVQSFTQRKDASSSPAMQMDTVASLDRPVVSVPVVAGRCLSCDTREPLPAEIEYGLQRLATTLGAGLLNASLVNVEDGYVFAGATPTVDVSRAEVADAMLKALKARS
jgi:hypothetical protein